MMISRRSLALPSKGITRLVQIPCARYNSTSTTPATRQRKRGPAQNTPITKVGVPQKPYIPAKFTNLPSPFTSPVLFIKCLARRFGLLGLNTLQIVDLRRNLKPNFLLWKNNAIEQYVLVNKAFATRTLSSVRKSCTEYVYNALEARSKTLPKNVELDWKLLKFNAVPKVVVFNNFPNEDGSTLCLQITYKFNTKQRLVTLRDGKVDTQDRDLVEYLSFNIDPYTDEVCLAGSAFESGPTDILYTRDQTQTQKEIMESMAAHGDIYRSDPRLAIEAKKN